MITKKVLLSKVKEFRKQNEATKLTHGQKSKLYGLITKDFTKTKIKKGWTPKPKKVGSPLFGNYGKRVNLLWPCTMHTVSSSFILSIGYNKEHKVLKVVTQQNRKSTVYAYAYFDVPFELVQEFMSVRSKGIFFNSKIKNKFPSSGIL